MTGYVCIAQQLTGVVKDGLNNESIPGAKIELKELGVATFTDVNGRFKLEGNWPDEFMLQVSAMTYESKTIALSYLEVIKNRVFALYGNHLRSRVGVNH